MTEVITIETPAPALAVELVDGEEQANILATLLKKHIEDIVAAEPSKADAARRISGRLGVRSTDPEAIVTLLFDNGGLRIRNGFDPQLDGKITGTLKLQTEVLAGLANPYPAMLTRKLKVGIRWSRPLFTLQTYGFLKAPESMRPARTDTT
jgi:hypothetical protein